MKIIDSFMLNNEIDLVLARMRYLYDFVDHFLIIEADRTHSNKSKPSYFNENIHRFDEFRDKIILKQIQFNQLVNSENSWHRENYQRDYIWVAAEEFQDDDIFYISDADEIPDTRNYKQMIEKTKELGALKLTQEMFYYNLSNRLISFPYWGAAYLITKENMRNMGGALSDLRLGSKDKQITHTELCGWHLTYFMSPENIKNKMQSFAHVEFDDEKYTDVKLIEERMKQKSDPYDRDDQKFISVNPDEHFPPEFLKCFGAWKS